MLSSAVFRNRPEPRAWMDASHAPTARPTTVSNTCQRGSCRCPIRSQRNTIAHSTRAAIATSDARMTTRSLRASHDVFGPSSILGFPTRSAAAPDVKRERLQPLGHRARLRDRELFVPQDPRDCPPRREVVLHAQYAPCRGGPRSSSRLSLLTRAGSLPP